MAKPSLTSLRIWASFPKSRCAIPGFYIFDFRFPIFDRKGNDPVFQSQIENRKSKLSFPLRPLKLPDRRGGLWHFRFHPRAATGAAGTSGIFIAADQEDRGGDGDRGIRPDQYA